jgi:hypothetical protein
LADNVAGEQRVLLAAIRFTTREVIGVTVVVACWAMLYRVSFNWFVLIAVTVLPALVVVPVVRGRRQWGYVRTLTELLVLSYSFFVLYMLSIGPVIWLGAENELESFYGPLKWLSDNTPIHNLLVWWAELWDR